MLKQYEVILPIHWKGLKRRFPLEPKEIEFDNTFSVTVKAHDTTEAVRLAEQETKEIFSILHTEERQNNFYCYSWLNDWLAEGGWEAEYSLKAPECYITADDRKVKLIKDYSETSLETMFKELTLTEFIECGGATLVDKYIKK